MRAARRTTALLRAYATVSGKERPRRDRNTAGFSMVELLVSVALMSVMTAILLQSFIVARRLNARVSTEQKIQTFAQTTMESMKAAPFTEELLSGNAGRNGTYMLDDIAWRIEQDGSRVALIYNDVGNGRGPVVSFGKQYGVRVEIDPTPYSDKGRVIAAKGSALVTSYNRWQTAPVNGVIPERGTLVRMDVVVYRIESRKATNGPEQLRLTTARLIGGGL
ncbi:MAG: type II secretion system protein [Lachnospiraceae bacterium]|nr:type II secretion system protein [Lachnospiraceae bacterium]